MYVHYIQVCNIRVKNSFFIEFNFPDNCISINMFTPTFTLKFLLSCFAMKMYKKHNKLDLSLLESVFYTCVMYIDYRYILMYYSHEIIVIKVEESLHFVVKIKL